MAQGVDEGALLVGEQRVDKHEAGRPLDVEVDRIDPARDGE